MIEDIPYENIVKKAYNKFLRDRLPRTWETYNGVEVFRGRPLDKKTNYPEYESNTCDQIHEFLKEGMSVTVVGDKFGVKTVHIGQEIGSQGEVYYFDGDSQNVSLTKKQFKGMISQQISSTNRLLLEKN